MFYFSDIVSRAFWFVARQLTLNDFLEASFGNCESFNRLKEPLQKYINEKIFPPENTEDENRAIIEQMVSNFDDLMEPFVVCIYFLSFAYLTNCSSVHSTVKSIVRLY